MLHFIGLESFLKRRSSFGTNYSMLGGEGFPFKLNIHKQCACYLSLYAELYAYRKIQHLASADLLCTADSV